jgi:hypothetical protein
MEMIVSRFGSHAFIQFDKVIKDYTIIILNNKGKILHRYLINNKDFLMVDDINSDKNYIIKILDHHNEIIARKKI